MPHFRRHAGVSSLTPRPSLEVTAPLGRRTLNEPDEPFTRIGSHLATLAANPVGGFDAFRRLRSKDATRETYRTTFNHDGL